MMGNGVVVAFGDRYAEFAAETVGVETRARDDNAAAAL
jgi:hypothetical protein